MRTVTVIAASVVLGTGLAGLPLVAASQAADPLTTTTPCPFALGATSVPGDPDAAIARIDGIAPEPGGTVTAYGATTRWSGIVDRFASVRRNGFRTEYSVLVRAAGPIEALVYQPPNGSCIARGGVRARNGYDAPDVQRPAVGLANPAAIEPIACAQPYAAAKTLQAAEPRTPEIAMQQSISGIVDLLVTLNDRGEATKATVLNSPSAILNNASIAAAVHSTYSPEIFRCRSVPSTYVFTVSYGVLR